MKPWCVTVIGLLMAFEMVTAKAVLKRQSSAVTKSEKMMSDIENGKTPTKEEVHQMVKTLLAQLQEGSGPSLSQKRL